MKLEIPEDPYETWLTRRRRDFSEAELSYQVMASVRSMEAQPETRRSRFASYFGVPSTIVGAARLSLFILLILIPA
jgi:hypothetical protein